MFCQRSRQECVLQGGALLLRGGIPDPGMAAVSVSLPSRVLGRSNKIKKLAHLWLKTYFGASSRGTRSWRGHQAALWSGERHDKEMEADLRLFDSGGTPITHRADVEVLLSFQVSLTKEFLHDSFHPPPVQVERLRRVAEVRAVNEAFQHLRQRQTRYPRVSECLAPHSNPIHTAHADATQLSSRITSASVVCRPT